MEKFDFISDLRLKTLLERDYNELERCISIDANKSILVLSGSIIEAVLVDYFLYHLPNDKSEKEILSLTLAQLIETALECKLISSRSKDLSTVIRSYRNLIHPGKEIREKEVFDKESAMVAHSLVNMILNDIKLNYLKDFCYSAQEIISKIQIDQNTIFIFGKLIEKMNRNEKIKLLNYLTDFVLNDSNLSQIKTDIEFNNSIPVPSTIDIQSYLTDLIHYLPRDIIETQLDKLVNEVETGTEERVMTLYELYLEFFDYLTENKRDIIIIYFLNSSGLLFSDPVANKNDISSFYSCSFFNIGKHIKSDTVVRIFKNFIFSLLLAHQETKGRIYLNIFAIISKDLCPSVKKTISEYIDSDLNHVCSLNKRKLLQKLLLRN